MQDNKSFGGVLPQGHGNDGLLQDLKRLLDEAKDLEEDFDEVIKRPAEENFFNPVAPASLTPSLVTSFAKRNGPKQLKKVKKSRVRQPTHIFQHSTPRPRPRPTPTPRPTRRPTR